MAGALVLTGTLFYWRFEDWTVIESLYFCVVTLTTVGYGDLSPTTAGTQIFTIVYILTGFGVLVALLTSVAQQYLALKAEGGGARARLKARRGRHRPTEDGPVDQLAVPQSASARAACRRRLVSSTEWRSIRMPLVRSATARRPKAPSMSWYSAKRRSTMSIELCQSCRLEHR